MSFFNRKTTGHVGRTIQRRARMPGKGIQPIYQPTWFAPNYLNRKARRAMDAMARKA